MTKYSIDTFNVYDTDFSSPFTETLCNNLNELNDLLNLTNYKMKKSDKKFSAKKTIIKIDNLAEIKKCLNKITDETYEENKLLLLNLFNEYDNKKTAANTIYDILSSNFFYSELSAKLFITLTEITDLFKEILNERKECSFYNYTNIVSINSNDNYDSFCKNNRKNDIIKSQIKFNSEIYKLSNLNDDYIEKIIKFLISKIKIETDEVIIYELIENINIIITVTIKKIKQIDYWTHFMLVLNKIKSKSEEYKHIKNKTIFKTMDILDLINKN